LTLPAEPEPLSRSKGVAYALGGPLVVAGLLFLPAGSLRWVAGWALLAVLLAASIAAVLVLRRVNPVIFRARSRMQPGTMGWDKVLVTLLSLGMLAILPVAALDAARFRWWPLPAWAVVAGYIPLLAGFALITWAQAVNPFFEPGVRIQAERQQRVVEHGPYAWVRHPGYAGAVLLFAGMALALGSAWALVPAALASAVLVLRTVWEDRLLRSELAGYDTYARRVRWRVAPGVW
jgi:protein-S-isoprenylcysteine O-methyltransferase Ste14